MIGGTPAPAWLDDLTLSPGPPWHSIATRAVGGGQWLAPAPGDDALIARKRVLLRDRRDDVVATLVDDGTAVARERVARFVAEAAGAPTAEGELSLEDVALHTAQDLCVLLQRDGQWRLVAGVVCFPSMWRVADKLGLPVTDIHGPVPAYAEEMAVRVDRLLDRLDVDRPVWRRNWFVHADPELFLPRPPPASVETPRVPDGLWLRSELQTLARIPGSDAILFAIRTHQEPFAVVASRPDIAGAMAGAIEAWPPELVAYRGAGSWRAAATAWLRATARGGRE